MKRGSANQVFCGISCLSAKNRGPWKAGLR